MEKQLTNIFDYSDYREYLADFYSNKKSVNPGYSHRVFAKSAGLSSPSHLSMIIKGTRNLSLKTIPKFADGLKLKARERKYFELLVQYNQADDLQSKAKYFSEILSMRGSLNKLHSLEKEKFDFLSKWYVVAIYVLIDLKNFDPDPNWIIKRLKGAVSVSQVRDALSNLKRLNMVEVTEQGKYQQRSGALTIADDTRSLAVYKYHQSMIRLAAEALRNEEQTRREMNGATFAIPADKVQEVKDRIRKFRKEINQLASTFEDPNQVYQMNIQLFPLSTLEDEES